MVRAIKGLLNVSGSQSRSKIVAKNAVLSLLLKGFSILISFVFVPLYLHSVGQRQYGIILTITSISNFISFFDVGIGNGLRSKLGEAIAKGNAILSKQYVSTAYFYVSILFTSVFFLYVIISPFIHWYKILNIGSNEIAGLDVLMLVIFGMFCARFILQLLGTVLMADQKSYLGDFMGFLTGVINISVCLILKSLHRLDFYSLLMAMCITPFVGQLVFSFTLYTNKYKSLRPSLKWVNHSLRKDLLGLGVKFFLLQITSIIIFSTTNILIAQLFSIGEVTRYNIAYKYYNITVMAFNIMMSPLWGAFANAWHQSDIKWIVKNMKIYLYIVLGLVVLNLIQLAIYPFFIHVWLKREFFVAGSMVFGFILYNFILCYNDIFAHFLASIGRVNKQLYAAVAGGIINIPLTYYLAKHTSLGLSAILFANVISLLPSTFLTTIQTINILKRKMAENEKLLVSK